MAAGRQVTVRDIAGRLGISPGTVSRALRARKGTRFVSEATRQRVRQVSAEMGYPLERLRSGLVGVKRVGILYAYPDLYAETILTLCDLLSRHGFLTFMQQAKIGAGACEVAMDWYERGQVDAAMFVGDWRRDGGTPAASLPCVFVGEVPQGTAVWQVSADYEAAGRAVGDHLWSLGHRCVGLVGYRHHLSAQRRVLGVRSSWERRGCEFPEQWILHTDTPLEDEVEQKLPAFLERAAGHGGPLTALYTWGDTVAFACCHWLADHGLRVPEDVSVVGFDDTPWSRVCRPRLTTLRRPQAELAALAMQSLLEHVRAPDQPPKARRLLCELVVRDSTGPVRVLETKGA